MAGIGFDLKKIFYTDSKLSNKAKATIQSFFVSSGPWITSIFTVGILKIINESYMSSNEFDTFIGIIIYSFVFSLILSSPIINVLTRYLSDLLYEQKFDNILSNFLLGFLSVGGVSFIAGFLYIHHFTEIKENTLRITYLFVSLNILWFVMIFVSMLKETAKVTIAFLAGMVIAIILNLFYAHGNLAKSLESFTIGVTATVYYLISLIFSQFNFNKKFSLTGIFQLKYMPLFFSGFFLYAGMWADKIIYWFFSRNQFQLIKGFYFFPQYDFAIFLGYLTIIPTTAYFTVFIETDFYEKQKEYLALLERDGSLDEIKKMESNILKSFYNSLMNLMYFQLAITIIFILIVPPILEHFRVGFESIPLLRISAFDALLQVIFNTIVIFLYYFDYQKETLILTFIFFILNVSITWITKNFPYEFTGYSYFISLIISNLIGFIILKYKLKDSTYYILMKSA